MSTVSSHNSWLLIGLAALAMAFAPIPPGAVSTPAQRHFSLQASQYAYAPAELHVNPGDTVTIELVSTDAVHGLFVDGYGVSMEADPGQSASVTFVADKPGSFRFRCNVTCGALHPFMIGKLTVGTDTLLFRAAGITLLGVFGLVLSLRKPAESGGLL